MRTLIISALLSLPLFTAACGDDASECDKVAARFVELAPEGIKDRVGDKSALAKRCEKDMSAEQRKCALKADSFESMMDCRDDK